MLRHDREVVREMLIMVRRTLEDGQVHEEEAHSLRVWLKHNPDMTVSGMGKEIAEKLLTVFADRTVTPHERQELLALLEDLAGQDPA